MKELIKNLSNTQKELFKIIAIILISIILSSVIAKRLIKKSQLKNKQIVSINLTSILKDFTIELAQSQKQEDEIVIKIQAFATNLDRLLKDLAESNNMIIIPAEASIAGARDITKDVMKFLNSKSSIVKNSSANPKVDYHNSRQNKQGVNQEMNKIINKNINQKDSQIINNGVLNEYKN